jgi:hypothetical protein
MGPLHGNTHNMKQEIQYKMSKNKHQNSFQNHEFKLQELELNKYNEQQYCV